MVLWHTHPFPGNHFCQTMYDGKILFNGGRFLWIADYCKTGWGAFPLVYCDFGTTFSRGVAPKTGCPVWEQLWWIALGITKWLLSTRYSQLLNLEKQITVLPLKASWTTSQWSIFPLGIWLAMKSNRKIYWCFCANRGPPTACPSELVDNCRCNNYTDCDSLPENSSDICKQPMWSIPECLLPHSGPFWLDFLK